MTGSRYNATEKMILVKLQDSEVRRIFAESMTQFNGQMLMNFSPENVHLQILEGEQICRTFISGWNRKPYAQEQVHATDAYEVQGPDLNFMAARKEIEAPDQEWTLPWESTPGYAAVLGTVTAGPLELSGEEACRESFLEQLTDIFCRNFEVDGGRFYQRYCMQSQQMNSGGVGISNIQTGYRLWEPFIRQIIMDRLCPVKPYGLRDVTDRIRQLEGNIQDCVHDPLLSGGKLFALIALARDGLVSCRQWETMLQRLDRTGVSYIECLHHLYRKIHGRSLKMYNTEEQVHRISPLFIRGLGERFTREREQAYYGKYRVTG